MITKIDLVEIDFSYVNETCSMAVLKTMIYGTVLSIHILSF